MTDKPTDNLKVVTDNPKPRTGDNFTTLLTSNMTNILKAIASGKTRIQTITDKIEGNKGNVYRTLQTLIKHKLVSKDEPTKSYFLTMAGSEILIDSLQKPQKKQVTTFPSTSSRGDNFIGKIPTKKVRSEKISFVCKIKNKPKDWERKRKTVLTMNHIEFNTANLKNHSIYSHTLVGLTIKNTTSSIIINFPEKETYCAQQAFVHVMYILDEIKPKIERFYGITLSGEFELMSQEHADLKTNFAAISDAYDVGNYYIFFDPIDKKPRWKIDKSKGFKEWETMHRELGTGDYDNINLRMADMADHHNDMPMPFDQYRQIRTQENEIKDILDIVESITQQNLRTTSCVKDLAHLIKKEKPKEKIPEYII